MTKFLLPRRAVMAGAASLLAAATLGLPTAALSADFAGKTLNFVNFGGPGSPPDVWYRTLLPYVEKQLGGGAKINVINKPGAGSMIAANYTANAMDADGLNFGSMNGVAMNRAAAGDESAKFDLNALEVIGAQKLTRLVAVKKDGIETIEDLLSMDETLIIGMESSATSYFNAFLGVTGIDAKIISSYQKFPDTLQAFRTGEVDAMPISVIEWLRFGPDLMEAGAVPMWQYGFLIDGEIVGTDAVDIPTGHDVAMQANADAENHPGWKGITTQSATSTISNQLWAPAGTPMDYVEALSAAFAAAARDPEYLAKHEKQYGLPAEWMDREATRAAVDYVINAYAD